MRRQSVWAAICGALCLGLGWAPALEIGSSAPAFQLMSGDGRAVSSEQIKGSMVVLFYETRDMVEQNRAFKNELGVFLGRSEGLREKTVVLAVINCSAAVWPVTPIWRAKLRDNSEKEGLTIYGDWDGKMAVAYGMQANSSNIVVLDPSGVVRYRRAGGMTRADMDAVFELLK